MKYRVAQTACFACAFLLMFGSTFAVGEEQDPKASNQEKKPILGFVVPEQTTMPQLEHALTEQGCEYTIDADSDSNSPHYSVQIDAECFDLPNDPVVTMGSKDAKGLVTGIKIPIYDPLEDYNRYRKALEKNYGRPMGEGVSDDTKVVLWEDPSIPLLVLLAKKVEAKDSEKSPSAFLIYYMGNEANKYYRKLRRAISPRTGKDLDNL